MLAYINLSEQHTCVSILNELSNVCRIIFVNIENKLQRDVSLRRRRFSLSEKRQFFYFFKENCGFIRATDLEKRSISNSSVFVRKFNRHDFARPTCISALLHNNGSRLQSRRLFWNLIEYSIIVLVKYEIFAGRSIIRRVPPTLH